LVNDHRDAERFDVLSVLIHGYFAIDKNIVWSVVERDLPQLEPQIRAWLTE
jgi:uncharacterized protein with HEPN domain